MNAAVSKYMREMQRRSAEARRAALSPEENRARMSALAKARWAKTKRKPKRIARRRVAEGPEAQESTLSQFMGS